MTNTINEQIIEAEIAQIGPRGIPGQAATINIGTVTTGAAGTDATVTNVGTENAAVLNFVIPQGAKGDTGEQGQQGIQGIQGETGNGISSIEKISSVGLVDTYRINLTNNTHYDFTVTNGSYISSIDKTSTSGLVDTYTITLTNGNTQTFTVTNGAQGDKGETGETGNGIVSINLSGVSGLVDTYTISMSNGTSYNYDVSNGAGVTGVTLLSWEGLTKTYRMSFSDNTYFDFEVTNGGDGQTDWGAISGAITDQTDLQSAFHSLKGYSDNGTILTDSVLYSALNSYVHSFYDLSKFTETGTVINDNGIISGFSTSNYLSKSSVFTSDASGNFRIDFKYKGSSHTAIQYLFDIYNTSANEIFVRREANGNSYTCAVWGGGSELFKKVITDSSNAITGFLEYKNGVYTFDINGTEQTADSTSVIEVLTYDLSLGVRLATGSAVNPLVNGSMDIKYLACRVSDYLAFSGNKTGVDIIKPNDYTEVGTPIISDYGILSGFSTSNYITKSNVFTASANSDFHIDFKYKGAAYSAIQYLFDIYNTASNEIFVRREANGNSYTCAVFSNGTQVFSKTLTDNSNDITGYIEYKNQTFTFNINGTSDSATNATGINAAAYSLAIGARLSSGSAVNPLVKGTMDLCGLKAHIAGNLIYQPCLLIPYTESLRGSRIADISFKDRVIDLFTQKGKALYFTIDEINQYSILPPGELYGFITSKLGYPDYNVSVSIASSPYTVKDNGYLLFESVELTSADCSISVNSNQIAYTKETAGAATTFSGGLYPVKAGDVITYTESPVLKFIKAKE